MLGCLLASFPDDRFSGLKGVVGTRRSHGYCMWGCEGSNITGVTLHLIINCWNVAGGGGGSSKSPWFKSEELGGKMGRGPILVEKLDMDTWRILTQRMGRMPEGRPLKTKARHQAFWHRENGEIGLSSVWSAVSSAWLSVDSGLVGCGLCVCVPHSSRVGQDCSNVEGA